MLLGGAALAGGAAALAGCAKKPPQELEPHPDVAVLRSAIATEEQLIAMYESTKHDHPGLSKRVDPLLAHHRSHLTVLRRHYRPGTGTEETSQQRPRSGAQAAGAIGEAGEVEVGAAGAPVSRRQTLAALRAAERKAASARTADVTRVAPGLAQLFASIAACEAGNASWLSRIS